MECGPFNVGAIALYTQYTPCTRCTRVLCRCAFPYDKNARLGDGSCRRVKNARMLHGNMGLFCSTGVGVHTLGFVALVWRALHITHCLVFKRSFPFSLSIVWVYGLRIGRNLSLVLTQRPRAKCRHSFKPYELRTQPIG